LPNDSERFAGVYPALLTPYASDGGINTAMLKKLVAYHIDRGCHGFFVCGSTGEGVFLSEAERTLVADTVIQAVDGRVPVIVQVGALSTDEAARLARAARAAGADAVSTLPPLYVRVGWEGVMAHVGAIAEAADLPTFYYHIPVITGITPTVVEFGELAAKTGLAGVKFTAPDLFLLWSLLNSVEQDLRVFYGADEQLYQGLVTGAHGGIGSTYNYQIENTVGVYDAVQRGDHAAAREGQDRMNRVIEVLFRHGPNRATEKQIMSLLGYDVGPPRRPTLPFSEANVPALRDDLRAVGLLEA
jgi:N-acetylneuraminate lyase